MNIVPRFEQADGREQRTMIGTEGRERLGKRGPAFDVHRRKRTDNPDPRRIDAEPREQRGDPALTAMIMSSRRSTNPRSENRRARPPADEG